MAKLLQKSHTQSVAEIQEDLHVDGSNSDCSVDDKIGD